MVAQSRLLVLVKAQPFVAFVHCSTKAEDDAHQAQ
ncbi:hypothetical protein BVRB_4g095360 [Beta vulgaris subsp. vulgaris]|uniref:Uncharacterized protein n=1 Tax=Beta vulgaris subsp. vulgaris TaxID=3555 RepID=A0A0J8E4T2_BETVV|nr:hypothetical protein BVRB_4g095360 [Beta vulgaris subsp. vulgaris]